MTILVEIKEEEEKISRHKARQQSLEEQTFYVALARSSSISELWW